MAHVPLGTSQLATKADAVAYLIPENAIEHKLLIDKLVRARFLASRS
jgi:hypothetical protein